MFEIADRGTLLIDEVDELALGPQARLLRVLESGCFSPSAAPGRSGSTCASWR